MLDDEADLLDEDDLCMAENVAQSTLNFLESKVTLSPEEQRLALVCAACCQLVGDNEPRVIH